MSSPTLIEALQRVHSTYRRCHIGTTLEGRTPEERDAYEEALAAKVTAGPRGTPYPVLAQVLAEVTGTDIDSDQVRRHAKKECSCE